MKKTMRRLIACALSILMILSVTACGKGEDISSDDKTLNIRVYKAGY